MFLSVFEAANSRYVYQFFATSLFRQVLIKSLSIFLALELHSCVVSCFLTFERKTLVVNSFLHACAFYALSQVNLDKSKSSLTTRQYSCWLVLVLKAIGENNHL